MDISNLRKYRINLENNINFFNSVSDGIAIFDLVASFLGAQIIISIFNLNIYYHLFVIPIGIIVHSIFSQNTFLNKKIFTFLNKKINVYQIILIINIIAILVFRKKFY